MGIEVPQPNRGPTFERVSYANLWTARLTLPAMELASFKASLASFVERTRVPVLGYISGGPSDGTMTYTMSRYPDFRTDRPPMPSIAESDVAAIALAQELGGNYDSTIPRSSLRAVIGLREGGYDPDAPIQDLQRVHDALPSSDITPAHMVAARFVFENGVYQPRNYDEPVALVEATQNDFAAIANAADILRQQHCPVEDFDRGVISMHQTRWAE